MTVVLPASTWARMPRLRTRLSGRRKQGAGRSCDGAGTFRGDQRARTARFPRRVRFRCLPEARGPSRVGRNAGQGLVTSSGAGRAARAGHEERQNHLIPRRGDGVIGVSHGWLPRSSRRAAADGSAALGETVPSRLRGRNRFPPSGHPAVRGTRIRGRAGIAPPYPRPVSADVWVGAATTLAGALLGLTTSLVLSPQQAREARLQRQDRTPASGFAGARTGGSRLTPIPHRGPLIRNAVEAYYVHPCRKPLLTALTTCSSRRAMCQAWYSWSWKVTAPIRGAVACSGRCRTRGRLFTRSSRPARTPGRAEPAARRGHLGVREFRAGRARGQRPG